MWQAAMAVAFMCGAAPLYAAAWLAMQVLLASHPIQTRRWADELMYGEYQEFCRLFFQLYTGTKFYFHGDAPLRESVLYMSNHQCTIDWLIVPLLASQAGLTGSVRYVLKNTLRLMPCYGWYFEQHGCVYVRKNFVRDEPSIRRALRLLDRWTTPVWLAIFPEGTRFNPDNASALAASRAFAQLQGLPPLAHVLVPRTKGLGLCIETLRGSVAAVYDVTVAYERHSRGGHAPAPSMADLMAGDCPTVHVYVQRHSLASLPQGRVGLSRWLHHRFAVKDRLLALHYGECDDAIGREAAELGSTRKVLAPGPPDGSAGSMAIEAEARTLLADPRVWTHKPPPSHSALRLVFWATIIAAATMTHTGRVVYRGAAAVTALGGLVLMLPFMHA
eukprot:m.240550 g.240550  ORF g.240550 m.240550 type:complete len:388 (+) comp23471_c0_seq1:140-1303(+)